jgi:hypothetical protein
MVTDGRTTDLLTNLVLNLHTLRLEHYLVLASEPAVCAGLLAGGVVRGRR